MDPSSRCILPQLSKHPHPNKAQPNIFSSISKHDTEKMPRRLVHLPLPVSSLPTITMRKPTPAKPTSSGRSSSLRTRLRSPTFRPRLRSPILKSQTRSWRRSLASRLMARIDLRRDTTELMAPFRSRRRSEILLTARTKTGRWHIRYRRRA